MSAAPDSGGPVSTDLLTDLAAASRILAAQGVVDGFGHVSIRHPDASDRYFLSRSMAPALVTPDDIIEHDLDSNACNADGRNGFSERFIHGQIYRARPDVMSVVHTHSPSVIPFGLVGTQMQAMFHNAAFLAAGVPVFDISEKFGDTDMMVTDNAKGTALADCLADKNVGLMRGHGLVTCAPSLQLAVFRAFYTEVSARIQHWTQALAGDGPIAALTEAEGLLADVPNETSSMRAWSLWRGQVRE
jgi:HCOMODA/2-hydroxy-3-carboxy-muconic semialdehyde decarboxylase